MAAVTPFRPEIGGPLLPRAIYGLSWFDAQLWAYAEVYGLAEIWSEDFEHGRRYGTVRVVDPFHEVVAGEVDAPRSTYG